MLTEYQRDYLKNAMQDILNKLPRRRDMMFDPRDTIEATMVFMFMNGMIKFPDTMPVHMTATEVLALQRTVLVFPQAVGGTEYRISAIPDFLLKGPPRDRPGIHATAAFKHPTEFKKL